MSRTLESGPSRSVAERERGLAEWLFTDTRHP